MSYSSYSSHSSYPRRQTTYSSSSSYSSSRYPERASYSGGRQQTTFSPPSSGGGRTGRVDPYWMLAADQTYNRVTSPSYLDNEFKEEVRLRERAARESDEYLPADDVYVDKLNRVLSAPPCIGVPPQPSCLIHGLYLGTQANAENLDCLKRHKITYVLNCAGLPTSLKNSRASRYEKTGIIYMELPIDDDEGFMIKNYFSTAHTFIERARIGGGRVLVHCTGVSRCGAIAISYLVRNGRRLLEAAKDVKHERRCVLCNNSFMKQLVEHARQHGMLDPEPGDVRAPKYGRELDKRRIWSAHLPMVL